GPESRGRLGQTRAVMHLQLARTACWILDQVPVTGQCDPRIELDGAIERCEVVAERIGTARRPEPDRRGDAAQQMVGCNEHAVADETQLAIGVAGRGDELPSVDVLAGLDEPRV